MRATDRDRPRRGVGRAAFTLVELLVSVAVFVLLGALLVGILSGAMKLWDSGETRRDTYERAQVVFEQISRDLATAYADPEPQVAAKRASTAATALPEEAYLSAGDAALAFHSQPCDDGSSWLAFTISRSQRIEGLFYRIRPDDETGTLLRGMFEPNDPRTTLARVEGKREIPIPSSSPQAKIKSPRDLVSFLSNAKWLAENGNSLSSGVLYFGLRFWTPTTNTWDPTVRPRKNPRASEASGPEDRWDATARFDRHFYTFDTKARDSDPLLATLPPLVRIELTVEREARRQSGTKLSDDLDGASREIQVDATRDFPEAPNWIKIDSEWLRYTARTPTSFTVEKRGDRGTAAARHKAASRVRCGETFVTIVPIPCARAR